MSKLTDDLRACNPITSPNVAGILMDAAAGRIEALEKGVPMEVIPLSPGPCIIRIAENAPEGILEGLGGWLASIGRGDSIVVAMGSIDVEESQPGTEPGSPPNDLCPWELVDGLGIRKACSLAAQHAGPHKETP